MMTLAIYTNKRLQRCEVAIQFFDMYGSPCEVSVPLDVQEAISVQEGIQQSIDMLVEMGTKEVPSE